MRIFMKPLDSSSDGLRLPVRAVRVYASRIQEVVAVARGVSGCGGNAGARLSIRVLDRRKSISFNDTCNCDTHGTCWLKGLVRSGRLHAAGLSFDLLLPAYICPSPSIVVAALTGVTLVVYARGLAFRAYVSLVLL